MVKSIKRTRSVGTKDKNPAKNHLFTKRRGCVLSLPEAPEVTYKNPELLVKFISEGGRKLPRRITSVCAKKQRQLKRQINIARILALLPFTTQIK